MARQSGQVILSRPATEASPRLSLKAGLKTSGYVDGAWWPGSLDLASEIPALVGQLADRWGAVDRVSYELAAWLPAVRQVESGGRRVRLDSFTGRRPSDSIRVIGAGRPTLTLLVIPPATDPQEAVEMLRCAGSEGNEQTVDDLLHRGPVSGRTEPGRAQPATSAGNGNPTVGNPTGIDDATADLGRWDAEGGHDRRRVG
jgi:hypothetical protein